MDSMNYAVPRAKGLRLGCFISDQEPPYTLLARLPRRARAEFALCVVAGRVLVDGRKIAILGLPHLEPDPV